MKRPVKVGLVSDTHARFDPLLPALFEGCGRILHAGDICALDVIAQLAVLAPVDAIRGNCDEGLPTMVFPETRTVAVHGARVLLVHDLGRPDKPHAHVRTLLAQERPDVVLSGHSHRGVLLERDGVLFVNPGSAGRKRFKLLRSAGLLLFGEGWI
ncbi:MAG: metallophosphoesterase family protein, partial [Myxococcales bacterium]